MKKIIILSTCFSLMVAVAFAQKPAAKPKASTPTEDTIQYSLGVYMMQQLFARTGFIINDPVMFKKAIDDVIGKKKLMVDPATTQDRLLAYQAVYQKQKGQTLERMLFDKVKTEKGFTELAGGVYYSNVKSGTGLTPTAKDTVVVNVICTLPDGTVVDDTNKSKQSYMAIAGEMIPGLQQALYMMKEGSISRVIIPSARAYGEAGTTTIPPSSAVIYDVALVSVKRGK